MGSQRYEAAGESGNRKTSRHIVLGILAHVDAGKTTLSESLLYLAGKIRRQGRVDHGDAYLDTDRMEKERGITIFAKQAEMVCPGDPSACPGSAGNLAVTLLDTPGHADFSPEMERTLSVLDYAVLVISAPDGVTGQVRTLWRLLAHYQVPVFLFVNKMDQPGMEEEKILGEVQGQLGSGCVCMPAGDPSGFDKETEESLAVCDDALLEAYLEEGRQLTESDISNLIESRKLFPVFFGSALKNEGVDALAAGLVCYAREPEWPQEFCARIFKISRDPQGARLSWVRVLGGVLRARMELPGGMKAEQIRQYSGSGFKPLSQARAGEVVCVTGLDGGRAGMLLIPDEFRAAHGSSRLYADAEEHLILPVFRSSILILDGTDSVTAYKNLRLLEEEEPLLGIQYDPETKALSAEIMGEVETQIVKRICEDRFGMKIDFGPADIVYRETIAAPVEGVGHYEPLRHYAEVHLLLQPTGAGSGLTFDADVSTDELALNWQRLIISNLTDMKFRGVLTGSEITDMRITVIGGRASEKHTEGGDFRQAAIRALRQGLMSARSILLEPCCSFEAEIPAENIGRLMADIERMEGSMEAPAGDGEKAVVTGMVPAAEISDYAAEVRAYTHGNGQISFSLKEYEPARHPEEIILQKGYDPAADLQQSPDSVFCSHGAGVVVPWDRVREFMHVDTGWEGDPAGAPADEDGRAGEMPGPETFSSSWRREASSKKTSWQEQQRQISAGEDELKAIFERTYKGSSWRTPLHNEQNGDIHPTGVWSRDGSLERSMGLADGQGEEAEEDRPEGSSAGPARSESGAQAAVGTKAAAGAQAAAGRPGAAGVRASGTQGAAGVRASGTKAAGRQRMSGAQAAAGAQASGKKQTVPEDYLLVDGYNIIFAWPDLRSLAAENLDSAAGKLTDILSDYQGTQSGRLIIVFDAYKVHGGKRRILHHGNVDVIYTKEAETADAYIMELTHALAPKGNVTVATGDGIVQMIIFSAGARRMSAAELKERVSLARQDIRERYHTDRP